MSDHGSYEDAIDLTASEADEEQLKHSGISLADLGGLRVVGGLTRLIERSRRLQEKGADLRRLRQYVERWVIWLHGGLKGAAETTGSARYGHM